MQEIVISPITKIQTFISRTLEMLRKMVLEKPHPSVFSLVLCSPLQAPVGSSGWWVQLHSHHPEVFAGQVVTFMGGVPSSLVLEPA